MRMAEGHWTFSNGVGELDAYLDRLAEELRSRPRPQAPVQWAVLAVIALVLVVVLVLVR